MLSRNSAVRLARLLPILAMGAFTFLVLPSSGCGKGIFPQVSGSATVTPTSTFTGPTSTASTPTSTASTPTSTASPGGAVKPFNLTGSGTEVNIKIGTCSGKFCQSTHGGCRCLQFSGSLDGTFIGNATWTMDLTVNIDDCENTGTGSGFCCIGDGLLTAEDKATDILTMSITGPVCDDPAAGDDVSMATNFKLLPSSSAGKFATSTGTGRFNAFMDAVSGDTYINGNGAIQLISP